MNESFPIYSIGGSSINKDWFSMPMDDVWAVMEDYLYFINRAYNVRIFNFVLMSNHYHLLAGAPDGNLPSAMQYLQSQSSRRIGKGTHRINHIWRAKYFRSHVEGMRYYLCAYKYFYRNPVEAKICKYVEEYPYSTLHGLLGFSKLIIPVEHDFTLFENVEATLQWLNQNPKPEHREDVRKALKKSKFKFSRNPSTGRAHLLEESPY